MKKQRKWIVLLLGTICFVALIVHGSYAFEEESLKTYNNYKLIELKNVAELQMKDVQHDYEAKINVLTVLAAKVAEMDTKEIDVIYNDMRLFAGLESFDYVGISDREGNAVDSDGNRADISGRSYFKEVMNGKSASISNVLDSNVIAGDSVQIMAVPIVEDGIIIGAIYGVHNMHMITETLQNDADSSIYTEIVDANGIPVTLDENSEWLKGYSNVWEFYEKSVFTDGSIEEVRDNIKSLKSGYYTLKHGDEQRITYYTPLGIEEYYVYSNIDISFMEEMMGKIQSLTNQAMVELTIALIIFSITIAYFAKMVFSQLRSFYEQTVSDENIMQLALQNSDIFLFEYDSKNNILKRKTRQRHLIFPDVITQNVPQALLQQEMIRPEFREPILDAFEQIKSKDHVAVTIQTTPEYQSLWLEISMKNIYDKKKRIMNTIGSVKNVTNIKKQEKLLLKARQGEKLQKRKAERDGLTGLYNSTTAIEKIGKFLNSPQAQSGKHLLVFMDLDNFKMVNDTFGHQYGNDILVEMANIFSSKFRGSDIVGRFGGDEFFAFLPNTRGFAEMEYVFGELVEECDKKYEEGGVTVSVSASFGIAAAPDHGTTFEELSQKADEMLLAIKREGKKGYRLYR